MKTKNWVLKESNDKQADEISETLGISSLCARILTSRGIKSPSQAKLFLFPDLKNLHNPYLLPGMEKAVARLRTALERKEKILIYGDSDVDGITSVVTVYDTIMSLGGDAECYVPADEGYGLNKEVIKRYKEKKVSLIVTVDCGISAFEDIEYANTLGIDTIVTDHHEVSPLGLPGALAVIDPKRADSAYPFKGLAGCAVAYKFSEALMLSYGKNFGKELVFSDIAETAGKIKLCALKIKNGILLDSLEETFNKKAERDLFLDSKLSDFYKNSVCVYYDAEKERKAFGEIFNSGSSTEYFDLKDLEKRHFPLSDSFAKLVELLGLKHSAGAALKHEAYLALDRLDDLRMKFFREKHLDVLALGTIADIVPLTDENRIFVKLGLRALVNSSKKGVNALIERCAKKIEGHISSRTVSWEIAPMLNSAGRLGQAALALELLNSTDSRKAHDILDEIIKLNSKRKSLQTENADRMIDIINKEAASNVDAILIVKEKNIEKGLLGVIASKIAHQYGKPAVVIAETEKESVGSCRSIPGFDILAVLNKLSALLIRHGGHSQAAGFTVATEKLDEFIGSFKKTVKIEMEKNGLNQDLSIDSELNTDEINLKLFSDLANLEPYGSGNPYPVFSLSAMRMASCSKTGTGTGHLRLKVSGNKSSLIDAVGWNLGNLSAELEKYGLIDIAFNLELNSWQSRNNLQLNIVDVKPVENSLKK